MALVAYGGPELPLPQVTFCIESTRTRAPYILILSVSIGVFATRILAFSILRGCPMPIRLSRMKPSSKKDSCVHGQVSSSMPEAVAMHQALEALQLPPHCTCCHSASQFKAYQHAKAIDAFMSRYSWQRRCTLARQSALNTLSGAYCRPGAHSESAAGLFDDVNGVQIGGALQALHRIHCQLGKVLLVVRQNLTAQGGAGNVQQRFAQPLLALAVCRRLEPLVRHTARLPVPCARPCAADLACRGLIRGHHKSRQDPTGRLPWDVPGMHSIVWLQVRCCTNMSFSAGSRNGLLEFVQQPGRGGASCHGAELLDRWPWLPTCMRSACIPDMMVMGWIF